MRTWRHGSPRANNRIQSAALVSINFVPDLQACRRGWSGSSAWAREITAAEKGGTADPGRQLVKPSGSDEGHSQPFPGGNGRRVSPLPCSIYRHQDRSGMVESADGGVRHSVTDRRELLKCKHHVSSECPKFCVRDFSEGGFGFRSIESVAVLGTQTGI